jgi:hypothetical protein
MKSIQNNLALHKRQLDILILLYRFRFLTRFQIQSLLKYKNHKQTLIWLNSLTENHYLNRYYVKQSITTPAVYSLGKESRKYLNERAVDFSILPRLLDRVWWETSLSLQFRNHCIFLADIYLSLMRLTRMTGAKLHYFTKTDLSDVEQIIVPYPDAYFAIAETDGSIKRYFLDLLEEMPPTILRRRVRLYFDFFYKREWQNNTDKPFPDIILICPNYRLQKHIALYIQSKLKDNSSLKFHLSCLETIKHNGLNRDSLQTVKAEE